MSLFEDLEQELDCLKSKNNLRRLPATHHRGREVEADGNIMLNLSSNDYLGLATDADLRAGFLATAFLDGVFSASAAIFASAFANLACNLSTSLFNATNSSP